MKYNGVLSLQVREYNGVEDGYECWTYYRDVIGVKTDNGVIDYKTGEPYDVIYRDENHRLICSHSRIKIGNIYAIVMSNITLNKSGDIDKYIKKMPQYTKEYKKMKRYKI